MKAKEKKKLDITFHNPNTPEETTKFVTKVFAQSAARVLYDKIYGNNSNRNKEV